MGYFLDEFKKSNPPTFDVEMKKSHDAEAYFLGMNKFYRLHDYLENMKAKIAMFSPKGKANILWEDMKNVKGIQEEELTRGKLKYFLGRGIYQRDTMMIG